MNVHKNIILLNDRNENMQIFKVFNNEYFKQSALNENLLTFCIIKQIF